jgi:hypothetical protein
MAVKKKKKAKKAVRATARATKKKKSPARKSKKTAQKSSKRPAKKAKKAARKSVKAAVKKAPARKAKKTAKKQVKGEGDYAASRRFLKDEAGFVEKNKANIPAMGKEAEAALDGPEGASLRDAEARAAGRSRDTFDALNKKRRGFQTAAIFHIQSGLFGFGLEVQSAAGSVRESGSDQNKPTAAPARHLASGLKSRAQPLVQ